MPTPECLDERTKAIISSLDKIEVRLNEGLSEVRACVEDRDRVLWERIDKVEDVIGELKADKAKLLGIGASVSVGLATLGFMFGDLIRTLVKRMLNI